MYKLQRTILIKIKYNEEVYVYMKGTLGYQKKGNFMYENIFNNAANKSNIPDQ